MPIHNFSPGPAKLPEPVLARMQDELTNWQNRGYSVLEVSHRSPQYQALVEDTITRLRHLLAIPDNYAVLFTTLSATAHFSFIPMNISKLNDTALYLNTGHWSHKAADHAQLQVNVRSRAIDTNHQGTIAADDCCYAHFCPNETIEGIAWPQAPQLNPSVPLVGDFSSCLLAGPLAISDYGLIYAGAQKNIGPAGISLLIIREDLLDKARANCPPACNYTLQNKELSLLHTPNTFGIYVINLVCQWLQSRGGLSAMAEENAAKAQLLYATIDDCDLYRNQIAPAWRSRMNVPFQLADPTLDATFLDQAEKQGMLFLKGHRAVGGMRANIYNAVPFTSVQALVGFMHDFARTHG